MQLNQTVVYCFSATFRQKVEKLARYALNDPIRVVQVCIDNASALTSSALINKYINI